MTVETAKASVEEEIRSLLSQGRIREAQKLLALAGEGVPADSRLRKALAPPVIKSVPRTGSDRSSEFHWLKTKSGDYSKKWVALLGEDLVAVADTLKELLSQVEAAQLSASPLIHHLD